MFQIKKTCQQRCFQEAIYALERKEEAPGGAAALACRRTSFSVSRATRSAAWTEQPLVSNSGCAFLD